MRSTLKFDGWSTTHTAATIVKKDESWKRFLSQLSARDYRWRWPVPAPVCVLRLFRVRSLLLRVFSPHGHRWLVTVGTSCTPSGRDPMHKCIY